MSYNHYFEKRQLRADIAKLETDITDMKRKVDMMGDLESQLRPIHIAMVRLERLRQEYGRLVRGEDRPSENIKCFRIQLQ